MLRVDLLDASTLRLSGRLAAGGREVVESVVEPMWGSREALANIVIDLSEVTYIDHAGEEVLCWLGQRGARFKADSSYAIHVCERLQLNMAAPPKQPSRPENAGKGEHRG